VKSPARGVRIGLAGWSEAVGRHRSSLPPAARFADDVPALSRYAAAFDFVEVNSSFYRQVRPATYANWAAETPDNFRFAVKMHRLITHYTRLKNAALLEPFFESVAGLGEKLAAVLVQLPPTLVFDPAIAAQFFAALRSRHPGAVVCEPRHASWLEKGAQKTLAAHSIGPVLTEIPAAGHDPLVNAAPKAPLYVRLHGTPRKYYSSYSTEDLQHLADFLDGHKERQSYVVFDNTAGPAGVRNALELGNLVR